MTVDLQAITLDPGTAVWLQDGGGSGGPGWHLESAADGWWLSSPPLTPHPVPSEHLYEVLQGLFVLQSESPSAEGLRVCTSGAGELVLQWRVHRPGALDTGSPSLEKLWPGVRAVWLTWVDVLEGRAAVQAAVPARMGGAEAAADARPISQLRRLMESDPELLQLRVEPLEDGALLLEAPHESWLVGAVADPVGGVVRLSTVIDALPPDPLEACRAVLSALSFNSGAILGHHLQVVAQMRSDGPGVLLLESRLAMGGADSEDIKAAIGELMTLGDELSQRLSDVLVVTESAAPTQAAWLGLHLRA